MPKRLKMISTEALHKNAWYEYKHDEYELPNGSVGNYYYSESIGTVVIVPRLADGTIAMVLQYRYLQDKQSIEFPGGGIGTDASAEDAAQRELLEETGYIAQNWTKIAEFEPSSGMVKDKTQVFLCDVIDKQQAPQDESEEIEIIVRKPEEIDDMIQRGDIWDGMSIATWTLVRKHI